MNEIPQAEPLEPSRLTRDDGSIIAYHRSEGKSPGVVFFPGFMSDMTGSKAVELERYCRARGQAFLRFDYTGHGQSSGAFVDGTIGAWTADALDVIDRLTTGPQVLVGSSMGGWIMLLAALARPERAAGLLGIAAAPDFTEDLIPHELTPAQRSELVTRGRVDVPSEYGPEPTQALMEDGRRHLVLRRPIAFDGPVRLIHGMRDPDVPWQTALRICQMMQSKDVEVTLVKDGDHRLSELEDLERLKRTLDELIRRILHPQPLMGE